MDRQLILHRLMQEEFERCSKLYKDLSKQYRELPKGSLLDRNGHIYHAFRENGKQYQKPISEDRQLQEDLKLRRRLKELLPDLKARTDACRMFLDQETRYDPYIIEEKLNNTYRTDEIPELFLKDDVAISKWNTEDYKRNPMPFIDEHFTARGIQVRSKSEALIGTRLETRGILYRCEPEVILGNRKAYPDFEIMLTERRRSVYLEHLGKMDDPDYIRATMDKLMEYGKHGIYLGINLFYTWEMQSHPLNIKAVDQVIDIITGIDKKAH